MAAAAPYIAMALAAGGTAYNQRQVAKAQQAEVNRGIETQSAKEREAADRVNAEIASVGASNPEAERKASADAFMQQLQRNRAASAAPVVDAASDRYVEDVATQTAASDTQAARIADLMSRINAPELQRRREAQGFGRLTTDVSRIGRESAGQDFLTRLRMQAIQPNPWVAAASEGLGAYGNAKAWQAPKGKLPAGELIDSNVNPLNTAGLA